MKVVCGLRDNFGQNNTLVSYLTNEGVVHVQEAPGMVDGIG